MPQPGAQEKVVYTIIGREFPAAILGDEQACDGGMAYELHIKKGSRERLVGTAIVCKDGAYQGNRLVLAYAGKEIISALIQGCCSKRIESGCLGELEGGDLELLLP
jgi:hypothetical protein